MVGFRCEEISYLHAEWSGVILRDLQDDVDMCFAGFTYLLGFFCFFSGRGGLRSRTSKSCDSTCVILLFRRGVA